MGKVLPQTEKKLMEIKMLQGVTNAKLETSKSTI
jgi:hypothetical protein